MYVDNLLLFSNEQALTTSADSTSSIDLGSARNIGVGKQLYVVLVVTEALEGSGAITASLEADSTTTFTPDGIQELGTFAAASAAGSKLVVPIAPGITNYRYMQLSYALTATNTGGAITAFITDCPQLDDVFPDNITIS